MRIVAGRFRGRVLAAPPGRAVRPTADRVREALFNTLGQREGGLAGLRVLDAFAGSGALGFEALSWGAAHVTFLEAEPASLAVIAANARTLGVADQVTIVRGDATRPPRATVACELLLLDPPYRSGLGPPALAALAAAGWIAPGAQVVVEVAAAEGFSPPKGLTVSDERRYGAARLVYMSAAG